MQLIWQYPEFFIALLLGGAYFFGQAKVLTSGLYAPATAVFAVLPARYQQWLSQMLVWGGFRSNGSVAALSAAKLYPALLATLLALVAPMALAIFIGALLFFVADLLLFLLVKKRQREISDALPQAIDLMLLCVDAGLGFDATLARVCREGSAIKNALNDELKLLSRDILLGMERESAYGELFTRSGVEDLRVLGVALNQSAKLGVSISGILRSHSEFIRTKQQQRAEERAAKLPVWMAFPLWFCIMPALMLILLGPSLILFISHAHPLPSFLM